MVLREIEKKFHLIPSLVPRFIQNRGTPPFASLKHLENKAFRDTYYDYFQPHHRGHDNVLGGGGSTSNTGRNINVLGTLGGWILENNKIWIRERSPGGWEAKRLVAGDYTQSVFEEITDIGEIQSLVGKYVPSSLHHYDEAPAAAAENFGLSTTCDFVTLRKTYLCDDKFQVMLDETDFGHAVGEVELMVSEEVSDEVANGEIEGFMGMYAWFFGNREGKGREQKPKGKISAYFERFERGERDGVGRGLRELRWEKCERDEKSREKKV